MPDKKLFTRNCRCRCELFTRIRIKSISSQYQKSISQSQNQSQSKKVNTEDKRQYKTRYVKYHYNCFFNNSVCFAATVYSTSIYESIQKFYGV
jgi:hypothetical protein